MTSISSATLQVTHNLSYWFEDGINIFLSDDKDTLDLYRLWKVGKVDVLYTNTAFKNVFSFQFDKRAATPLHAIFLKTNEEYESMLVLYKGNKL